MTMQCRSMTSLTLKPQRRRCWSRQWRPWRQSWRSVCDRDRWQAYLVSHPSSPLQIEQTWPKQRHQRMYPLVPFCSVLMASLVSRNICMTYAPHSDSLSSVLWCTLRPCLAQPADHQPNTCSQENMQFEPSTTHKRNNTMNTWNIT